MNKKKRKRKNNKGFTLVEILIAVAIIAVVVAPILKGMVVSMKVNNRADRIQKETGVAQGIMEGMSGLSLEELALSLGGNSTDPLDFLTMPAGAHKEFPSSPSEACITSKTVDGNTTYEFTKNSSNVYYFGIENVEYDGKKYDVRIKLDASDYYNLKKATPTPGYNEVDYVDISNYDETQDGLYVYSEKDDSQVAQQIAQESSAMGQTLTVTDVFRVGSRTIRIKVYKTTEKDNNGADVTITKVDMTSEWQVPSTYVAEGSINQAVSATTTIFNSRKDDPKELRNLYFLYNPNYKSLSTSSTVRDKIIIENEENIDMNFILVKQNSVEEATMKNSENMYHMELESVCATTDGSDPTHIRTNLGYNLHDSLYADDYGKRNVKVPGQCTLRLRNTHSNMNTVASDFFSYVSPIAGTSQGNERMYTKTVEIWPTGSYTGGFSGSPQATISSELEGTAP